MEPLPEQLRQALDQLVRGIDGQRRPARRAGALAEMGVEQAQKGMQPAGGRQGGVGIAVEQVLPHRHRRTQPADLVHIGGRQARRSRAERIDLQEAPARLVVERVEHQRGLARARHPGDHGQPRADLERDVLQVVLARAADADGH